MRYWEIYDLILPVVFLKKIKCVSSMHEPDSYWCFAKIWLKLSFIKQFRQPTTPTTLRMVTYSPLQIEAQACVGGIGKTMQG